MLSIQFIVFVIHLSSYLSVCGWKFDILGLDENKIRLARIAVYNNRAFIAIPRVYDEQPFTLVEVPWPELSLYTIYHTKPFPAKGVQVTLFHKINQYRDELATFIHHPLPSDHKFMKFFQGLQGCRVMYEQIRYLLT